jgi:hypothetical protein
MEGYALVVFPKREALGLPFEGLRAAWCSTLRRQGLFRHERDAPPTV